MRGTHPTDLLTAKDGGNAVRLSGTISATAKDGGNAVRLSGTIFVHAPELLRTQD
ncbi:MAG: hypothetical protein HFP77_01145 [Methylococcales symbiont of Iophon sp. n. MRB-2018]|nr:MAG: hypothetical protein HFP77_01145 [Methylococcales symbiont of Iophon sp. n. MRB-2018]